MKRTNITGSENSVFILQDSVWRSVAVRHGPADGGSGPRLRLAAHLGRQQPLPGSEEGRGRGSSPFKQKQPFVRCCVVTKLVYAYFVGGGLKVSTNALICYCISRIHHHAPTTHSFRCSKALPSPAPSSASASWVSTARARRPPSAV